MGIGYTNRYLFFPRKMHKYMTGMPVILNQKPKTNLCFVFFVAQVQPDIDPLSCVEQLSEIHSAVKRYRAS